MNTREADIQAPLKLDLGCGTNKRAGFVGVDSQPFPGVDIVADLRQRWPWGDGSVAEVFCSHFVEHLEAAERIHFVNELHRVLVPGGKARIITPHWASGRAFGDLTHKWPPVSEFWYKYLSKEYREKVPHNDFYTCDFEFALDYALRDDIATRSDQDKVFAVMNFKEAAQDLIAFLTKRA